MTAAPDSLPAIEQWLRARLGDTPEVAVLARLLGEAAAGRMPAEMLGARLEAMPALGTLVRGLAGQQLEAGAVRLSFAQHGAGGVVALAPHLPASLPPAQVQISGGIVNAPVVGVNHGTIISVTLHGSRLDPASLPAMVRCPPPRPPLPVRGFLDRVDTLAALEGVLHPRDGAWLSGPPGCGLTALLRQVMNGTATRAFADGCCYLDASSDLTSPEDLLQRLYATFFMSVSGEPVRQDPAAAAAALSNLHSLVVLDGIPLEMNDLVRSADTLAGSGCVLIAAAAEAPDTLLDVDLGPLPVDDARKLLLAEARLDAATAPAVAIDQLIGALGCLPLPLLLAGRLVRLAPVAVDQLAAAAAAPLSGATTPIMRITYLVLQALTPDQRAILAALVHGTETSLDLTALTAVSRLTAEAIEDAAGQLVALRLINVASERYSVVGGSLRAALARLLPRGEEQSRAAAFFLGGAGTHGGVAAWVAREAPNLQLAARSLLAAGRPAEAARLAQVVQPHYTLSGTWSGWGESARLAAAAAEQSGDQAVRAWALHERGTRAGMRGERDLARESLQQAYELRRQLGDTAGAALSRHNLEYLGLAPLPPPGQQRPPRRLPLLAGLAGGLVLLAVLAALFWPRAQPSVPPTVQIDLPLAGTLVRVGQTLELRGQARDAGGALLPAEQLRWTVTLVQGQDRRVILDERGTNRRLVVPPPGDLATAVDAVIEVQLSARNAAGLEGRSAARVLRPELANVTLATEPAGLQLRVADALVRTPADVRTWVGMDLALDAPPQTGPDGTLYVFERWSDGQPGSHTLAVGPGSASVTATFSPLQAVITVPDVTVEEGGGQVAVPVRLSTPLDRAVELVVMATGQEAVAGEDFQLDTETLRFGPGAVEQAILLSILDDALDEAPERLVVSLGLPEQVRAGRSTVITIADNDPPPSVTLQAAPASERDRTARVTVMLSAPSGQPVVVRFTTRDDSARAGEDYQATEGTVTIPPGQTTAVIGIPLLADDRFEGPERLVLALSGVEHGQVSGAGQVDVMIDDDDVQLVVGFAGEQVEVQESAGEVAVGVVLDRPATERVTVLVTTRDGTAAGATLQGSSDYQPFSGTVVFEVGEQFRPVTVPIRDDRLREVDETFVLELSAPTGARMGQAQSMVVIRDNDADTTPPGLSIRVAPDNLLWECGVAPLDITILAPDDDTVRTSIGVEVVTIDNGAIVGSEKLDAATIAGRTIAVASYTLSAYGVDFVQLRAYATDQAGNTGSSDWILVPVKYGTCLR